MGELPVRAAFAAGLAVLGALWLVFWTVLGATGDAAPVVFAIVVTLLLIGAWRFRASAGVRRRRRFTRRFPLPVRGAVTVLLDEARAARVWGAAGLSRPVLVDRAGDGGLWPIPHGAAVRVQRRRGHHAADYAGAAPVLARILDLAAVRVSPGKREIVLHLYPHRR